MSTVSTCDYQEVTKFTWGDSVRIAGAAPAHLRPGSAGAVVGISEQHERSGSYLEEFPSGVVYNVEFGDGSTAQVQEDYLIPLELGDDSA
jgi:hypothetical protein